MSLTIGEAEGSFEDLLSIFLPGYGVSLIVVESDSRPLHADDMMIIRVKKQADEAGLWHGRKKCKNFLALHLQG